MSVLECSTSVSLIPLVGCQAERFREPVTGPSSISFSYILGWLRCWQVINVNSQVHTCCTLCLLLDLWDLCCMSKICRWQIILWHAESKHEHSWIMHDASEPKLPVYHECWTYISVIPVASRAPECCSMLVDCARLGREVQHEHVTPDSHPTHTSHKRRVFPLYSYAECHENLQKVFAQI